MKVHILDDWFDTLRTLQCFAKLDGHDVTVWTDHEPNPAKLAARVADAECFVLFRERTKVGARWGFMVMAGSRVLWRGTPRRLA